MIATRTRGCRIARLTTPGIVCPIESPLPSGMAASLSTKLRDRQRDCRPLSELGRAVRSSVAPEPPSGETDDYTEDHMEDRVPSPDVHTERGSDGGSKNNAQDDRAEQDQGLSPWRSWPTAMFGTAESCPILASGRWLPAARRWWIGVPATPTRSGRLSLKTSRGGQLGQGLVDRDSRRAFGASPADPRRSRLGGISGCGTCRCLTENRTRRAPSRPALGPHRGLRRRRPQAVSGSVFALELLALPPQHAGVNVDDEPPARGVARVAADRPRVGHAGAGPEPSYDSPGTAHRARRGAIVGEERRIMRMADEAEGA
jgi:hypothetical protein